MINFVATRTCRSTNDDHVEDSHFEYLAIDGDRASRS